MNTWEASWRAGHDCAGWQAGVCEKSGLKQEYSRWWFQCCDTVCEGGSDSEERVCVDLCDTPHRQPVTADRAERHKHTHSWASPVLFGIVSCRKPLTGELSPCLRKRANPASYRSRNQRKYETLFCNFSRCTFLCFALCSVVMLGPPCAFNVYAKLHVKNVIFKVTLLRDEVTETLQHFFNWA